MFSLKASVLAMLGISPKDNETDVEAFERIQEKFSADQAASAQAVVDAEKNFSDQVATFEARFTALEDRLKTAEETVVKANEAIAKANKELEETRAKFAKQLAEVKTGTEPVTDANENDPTPPNADGEVGVKVAAWTKPIVKIKQHV